MGQQSLPELVQKQQQRDTVVRAAIPGISYDAAQVTFSYVEGGVRYTEKVSTLIKSWGPQSVGMWSNLETVLRRAPADQFDVWDPILTHIKESARLNDQWLAEEQISQEILTQAFNNAQQAERWRAQRRLEMQRYIQDVNRQITEHRQQVQAEIRNDQYLTMTNQEEYTNPYTNEVDLASNQWNYRWVNDRGEEFYTNHEGDDPNSDPLLRQTEWKRTPVRPRYPDGPAR